MGRIGFIGATPKLELQKETYVDKFLRRHMVDVLYLTSIDDKPAYVYFLTEHMSKQEVTLPLRLMRYCLNIIQNHLDRYETDRAPLVFTMVIYNGQGKYRYSMDWFSLFGDYEAYARDIFTQPFQLIDLTQVADEELRQHASAGLMEFCLKHAKDKAIIQSIDFLKRFLLNDILQKKPQYFEQVLTYIVYNMDEVQARNFFDSLAAGLPQENSENIMTIAERLIQEGRQEGMQQGMQQGVQQVALNMLKIGLNTDTVMAATSLSSVQLQQLQLELAGEAC